MPHTARLSDLRADSTADRVNVPGTLAHSTLSGVDMTTVTTIEAIEASKRAAHRQPTLPLPFRMTLTSALGGVTLVLDPETFDFRLVADERALAYELAEMWHQASVEGYEAMDEDECPPFVSADGHTTWFLVPMDPA